MLYLIVLKLFVQLPFQASAPDVDRIISLLRKVAPTYDVQDLIYNQKLLDWQRTDSTKKWRLIGKSYSVRLMHDGREYSRHLASERDTKINPKHWRVADFGCKTDIFERLTRLPLKWTGWADAGGHPSAVFEFSVQSTDIDCSTASGHINLLRTLSGIVYADRVSGQIWRLKTDSELPKTGESFTATNDYQAVDIGGDRQVVAVGRVEATHFSDHEERIEWTWSNFRRFQAETTIRFDSEH